MNYIKGKGGIQNAVDNKKARKSGAIGENIVRDCIEKILTDYDDLEYQMHPEDLTQIFIEEMCDDDLIKKFDSIKAVMRVNNMDDIIKRDDRSILYKISSNSAGFRFGVFVKGVAE